MHIRFWLISATRSSCYMQCLGREWVNVLGFPPVVYLSSNGGVDICAIPTVDAVATGEINYYEGTPGLVVTRVNCNRGLAHKTANANYSARRQSLQQ